MQSSNDNPRDNPLIEARALLSREASGPYGRPRTPSLHIHYAVCRWCQATVDHYGLNKELVFLSYHYFDRYSNDLEGDLTQCQILLISIASLLIAIKAKLSHVEARVVDDIVEDMVVHHQIDRQALSSREKEMLRALDGHLNPPTMQQFVEIIILLHPLTLAGDNFHAKYLLEAAIIQFDGADPKVQAEVMMSYRPSGFAYDAISCAQYGLDKTVLNSKMREEFKELMDILDLDTCPRADRSDVVMPASNDSPRDSHFFEARALLSRERNGPYGRPKTFLPNMNNFSRQWQDPVDRYGLDKELVFLSYHYFDRYINHQNCETPSQHRLNSIACLLIAIKANLSNEEAHVVDDIVEDMVVQHQIDRQALSSTEMAILSVLNWHLYPPTMHQFARAFCLLHPLTAAGDNFHAEYLLEATIFQVERALDHADVMMNRSPSYIAYAAMMRAQDELDENVFTSEMMDKVDGLMNELELCDRFVEETRFALENTIRRLPTIDEYMDSREQGEPLAVAIERKEAAIAVRLPPETIRSRSPNNVASYVQRAENALE